MDSKTPNHYIEYVGDKPETYVPEYRHITFRKGKPVEVPQEVADRLLKCLPIEFKKSKGDNNGK